MYEPFPEKVKQKKLFLSLQMEVGRVLVLLTILLLVVAIYTTQTTPKAKDISEIPDISRKYKIKPGHKIEPVIFEPQKKIRLSRSTYKVNSYIDFKPYKETFKQFGYYMVTVRFLKDIHDPHYVGNLYNINRPKGSPLVQLGQSEKHHFGTFACKQATYKCRIQNQYAQLRREAFKLNSMYRSIHEKFLRAIDHMEFHPTLGRPKEKPEVRLKRQTQRRSRQTQTLNQIKKMTKEDVEMIEKIDEWLSMQYRQTSSPRRDKRFGLATWVLGWGVYRTYDAIRHIKDNIRTLQEQNLLQQDQIIELRHYLNIT